MLSINHTTNQISHRSILVVLVLLITALLVVPVADAKKVKLKRLPDNLGKDGLVVMQIAPSRWEGAEVKLSNGKKGEAHNGFFVQKLKPGTYSVSTVKGLTGTTSNVLGTSLVYTILTVNREFEIKPGKITHLGMLYMLAEPGTKKADEKREYLMLPFRNQGSEQAFLQEFHPGLAANVSSDDVIMAPGKYINDKAYTAREMLFKLGYKDAYALRQTDNEFMGMSTSGSVVITDSNYIVGDLGLVAIPTTDGKLEILSNESVDRMSQVKYSKQKPWFYSAGGNVYKLTNNKLAKVTSMPADFFPTSGAMLSDTSLVFSDRRFNFLISLDDGQTWQRTTDFSLANNQSLSASFVAGKDRIYAIGKDSAYLLKKAAAIVVDRQTGAVSEFDVPKKIKKRLKAVFETDAGLFVQTEKSGLPTTLHFRKSGTNDWVKSEVGTKFGCRIAFPNKSGKDIIAKCGSPKYPATLVSQDFGTTWNYQAVATAANE